MIYKLINYIQIINKLIFRLTPKVINSSNNSEGEQKKLKKNTSDQNGEFVDFCTRDCLACL